MKSLITATEAELVLSHYRDLCPSAKNDLELSRSLHEGFAVMTFAMGALAIAVAAADYRHWAVSFGLGMLTLMFAGYAAWQSARFSRIRRLFEAGAPQNLADVKP